MDETRAAARHRLLPTLLRGLEHQAGELEMLRRKDLLRDGSLKQFLKSVQRLAVEAAVEIEGLREQPEPMEPW